MCYTALILVSSGRKAERSRSDARGHCVRYAQLLKNSRVDVAYVMIYIIVYTFSRFAEKW